MGNFFGLLKFQIFFWGAWNFWYFLGWYPPPPLGVNTSKSTNTFTSVTLDKYRLKSWFENTSVRYFTHRKREKFLWERVFLYVHSSFAIVLMGKRELVALLSLSSWCLVMVVCLYLAVPWVCLRFVIVVFPDHTHLLFLNIPKGTEVHLILEIRTCNPLICSMNHPRLAMSNQMEEFTSIQRVNENRIALCLPSLEHISFHYTCW